MFHNTSTSSNFQYLTKSSYVESNIPEKLGSLNENLLEFSTYFESGEATKPYLWKIAQELKTTARYFGEQQGLTRTLDFIEAEVWGNYINFRNTAKDEYGRYYAGHVEYGHYSRNKKGFVEARPFMRPALYAVSKASKGELGDVLSDMMMTIFRKSNQGYQGISKLDFGERLGASYHKTATSNFVSKALSSQKIFEVSEGKKRDDFIMRGNELNLMPGFEKRMSGWSVKRGQKNTLQTSLRNDAGWTTRGRSLHNMRQKTTLLGPLKETKKRNNLPGKNTKVNWTKTEREEKGITDRSKFVGQGPKLIRGGGNLSQTKDSIKKGKKQDNTTRGNKKLTKKEQKQQHFLNRGMSSVQVKKDEKLKKEGKFDLITIQLAEIKKSNIKPGKFKDALHHFAEKKQVRLIDLENYAQYDGIYHLKD